MADTNEIPEDDVEIYVPPSIDSLFEINGEYLRVHGVHVRDNVEDGSVTLYINLTRLEQCQCRELGIVEDVPQVFKDAFKESE